MSWAKWHKESENSALEAHEHLRLGRPDQARISFEKAADAEEQALRRVDPQDKPRTYSITAVSAVALWYKAGEFTRAQTLAAEVTQKDYLPAYARTEIERILANIERAAAAGRVQGAVALDTIRTTGGATDGGFLVPGTPDQRTLSEPGRSGHLRAVRTGTKENAMLNGYWLFCEPNTQIARNPAQYDEFIALFKHACLFQREVNLSDMMVVGSPNFRRAYNSDTHFKKLVHSPWVNISLLHRKGRTGPPMDLVDVKDFHHRENLYSEEDRRYFEQEGSDRYLRALQAKSESTVIVRDGTQRDPIFTRRVLDGLDGEYLKTHLGEHAALFAQVTREYQAEGNRILGAIHFENGRKDGRFRFGEPMVWDVFFDALADRVTAAQRDAMSQTIWRFYRANLVRAESDLMGVDPIQPPESQFYVEAMFGKSLRQMIALPNPEEFRVYSLSTSLDDAALYRHLDFDTIEKIRRRASPMFDAAAARQVQKGLDLDGEKDWAARRAAQFEAAMVEYLQFTTQELTQRFTWAQKPSLLRQLRIQFATLIADSVVDSHGRPKPLVTTVFNTLWTAAVTASSLDPVALQFSSGPQLSSMTHFLTAMVAPWLAVGDSRLAAATTTGANRARLEALSRPEERAQIKSNLVTPGNIDLPGSVVAHGTPV